MKTTQALQFILFVCTQLIFISFSNAQCETGIQITSADGARVVYTCPGDGIDDIITFSHSENSTTSDFTYVITDDNNMILGIPPSNSQNFEGAGVGTCRVWGFSYTGDVLAMAGESIFSTFFSSGCWAISSTFLEVQRSVPDGGMVAMPSGATSKTVCTTDGYDNAIIFTNNSSSKAAYQYVVTDDQNNILGLPGSSLNFEGVPPGVCRVWGLSYTGSLTASISDNAAAVALSDACFDLSDNFIEVTRIDVDGGTVSDIDGNISANTCTQDGVDDIIMFAHESASTANYSYFITDENNYVLGVPPSNSANFDGAPAGNCRVWGISYTGDLRIYAGDLATDKALSSDCFDLSSNFIEVVRQDCSDVVCDVPSPEISIGAMEINNRVVIANRASGTISVINGDQGELMGTYAMPDDGEPMYVVHNTSNNTVLVGDYNGKVVAFDGVDFSVIGSATAGEGVFHMWLSPDNQQLWINNEIDKTISVINPNTMETLITFDMPIDLLMDFKPHDVIIDPDNSAAYVTFLSGISPVNYVVKYSTTIFEEMARAEVGEDPHVSLTASNNYLYVASQGADMVHVFDRSDLSLIVNVDVPNAHGLGMNADGTYLYISNISDGGENGIYTLDLSTNTLLDESVNTPYGVPHNFAVGNNDSRLYITHSGGNSDKLTIFDLDPNATFSNEITVESNPFGLVSYTYISETTIDICAGDGQSDAFDVTVENGTASDAWIITDVDGMILGLPVEPPFDLEGAGAGVCLIWYANIGDDFEGAVVGNNAFTDLTGCYMLSNPITVNRDEVFGGTVSTLDGETTVNIVVGDGNDDIISFMHEDASNSNYTYVITDDQNNILALPEGNSANFEDAPAGVCRVWGLAYTGNLRIYAGDLATDKALSDDCFQLSSNFVEVVRENCGDMPCNLPTPMINTAGVDALSTCAGDGQSDAFDVTVENGTASDAWIITDAEGTILGLPASPPFDLEGAGAGVCLVWYANIDEGFAGAEVGSNAFTDLTGCYAFSNPITVTRTSMNAGEVSMPSGATTRYTCANDGVADMVMFTTTSLATNYQYVITDENYTILGLPPSNSLDVEGAGIGVCLVWGLAYDGAVTAMMGDNIMETALSDGCYGLSSNFITVNRDETFGGTVSMPDGETTVSVIVGDGNDDIIDFIHEDASNSNYTYVITDDQNNILALPEGNSANFEGAPAGICRVWGLAYTGTIMAIVGDNATEVALTDGCFDLSVNFIEINRSSNSNGNNSDAIIINTASIPVAKTTLYPNPAQATTTIRLDLNETPQNVLTLEIVNLTGQVVLRQIQTATKGFNEYQLNIADLDNGVYFINIYNEEGIYSQNRFLKVN